MKKSPLPDPRPAELPRLTGEPLYVLDNSHGLGSNQIHGMSVDRNSRLWLATPVGLACFDGSYTRQWNRNSGLQCNGLRSVAIDGEGKVWIGTDLGLELLDSDGNPVECLQLKPWRFGLCQHISIVENDVWVGTALGLVRISRADSEGEYKLVFSADTGYMSDTTHLGGNRMLAVSASIGLLETDGTTWWRYQCEGLKGKAVLHVKPGRNGTLLVGTVSGLFVIDDDGLNGNVLACLSPAQDSTQVTAIAVDVDRYWVAFGRTLVAYQSDSAEHRILECFQVESTINDLVLDGFGNIWIATNTSGLCHVSCLRFALQRIELGSDGGVYSIRKTSDECYQIGGERMFGLASLPDESQFAKLESPKGLPDTVVWDSLKDEHGIWAATQAGLFFAPEGLDFDQVLADNTVIGAPNRVLQRRGNELMVGTLRGLARIVDGSAEDITDADNAQLGYVYAMQLDDASRLWIGTLGRGLWVEQDSGLQQLAEGPLTSNGNTYSVSQGPEGRVIVLQDEKIILLEPDMPARLVTETFPVAGWSMTWVDASTIAVGNSDGLRIVDIETGNTLQHIQALLRQRDWEFTNNRTLIKDKQGRFLCGLSGGLVRVDSKKLQSLQPPECKLVDVVWSGIQPERTDTGLTLRPGRWSFRLRAYSAWFVDSSQVRYQFQLVGFSSAWTELGDRPEIVFTSLPPGKYSLLCRAYSPLAGLGPQSEILAFVVSRPLWAMGWTAALSALESFYDRVVRSRKRNDELLELNRKLESAVEERTGLLQAANQELEKVRDDFKLLSEVDELTKLGNRRRFEIEIDRTLALARRLKRPLALLIIDVDYFKLVNDHYGHQIGDDYLRRVAGVLESAIRKGEDVATRFGGEEFAVILFSTGTQEAMQSADRIRKAIEQLALPNSKAPSAILTASIGVGVMETEQVFTSEELVSKADRALYRAKHEGRNRVVLFQ